MEAVGQLPESLRTEGRTALAHSSPTRRVPRGGPRWWKGGGGRAPCGAPGLGRRAGDGEMGSGEGRAVSRGRSGPGVRPAGPGDLGGQDSKPGECTAGSEAARGLESRARATGLT